MADNDDKTRDQTKIPGGGNNPSQPGHGGGQGDTPAPKAASPDDYKDVPGNQT